LLGLETREAISINTFRKNILSQITIPPPYCSFGKRYTNQAKTQLYTSTCDLHKRNITNSPYCLCEHIEDAYHFFFACKNYSRARNNLFNRLFSLDLVNTDTKCMFVRNCLIFCSACCKKFRRGTEFVPDPFEYINKICSTQTKQSFSYGIVAHFEESF
jgi:hypothetical protein